MQVPIRSIVIKDRIRRDMGDMAKLMESLQKFGQMNPVIITRDGELIAGHRRVEAARRLGWHTIDAVKVGRLSPVEKLEMELDENVHRKDLSPAELVEGYTRLEELKRPSLWARIKAFFMRLLGFWKRERGADSPTVAGSPLPSGAAPQKSPGGEPVRATPGAAGGEFGV
jgi:ParB family chromosome partitioning protein